MRLSPLIYRFSKAFSNAPGPSERYLQLAIIGSPNCGKSMLANRLARAEVSAVSNKMDTTLQNTVLAFTENNCQVVITDTPGTIGIKHAKEVVGSKSSKILTDPENALKYADHVLVVHDCTNTGDYLHHRVLHLLHRNSHLKSTLVMNKIDLITRRSDLLELVRILCNGQVGGQEIVAARAQIGRLGKISNKNLSLHLAGISENDEKWQEAYRKLMLKPTSKCDYSETKKLFRNIRGWPNFDAVFYTSCVTDEGIAALRKHLLSLSLEKPHKFKADMVTTKNPQLICRDAIRAQLLDNLPSDIAYKLQIEIVEWEMDGEVLQIVAVINCPEERLGKYVIGINGSKISRIATNVNRSIQNLFKQQLFIRILVKGKGKLLEPPEPKSQKSPTQ
uniref:GTPase Era, mitochondrial n=1 Tax=Syphacia muris TaxID=451379 RepID=A0A0N5AIC4_9BILA